MLSFWSSYVLFFPLFLSLV
uniref:Uncharacterized protein n=1 Tax=Rhizophora mucronata TaxID=61149 RepID=A0A2P2ND63_RHIMU